MHLEFQGYKVELASIHGLIEFKGDPFVDEIYSLWKERRMMGYVMKIERVGFLLLEDKRELSEMVIRGFYVKPEHRNKGIGKILLKCLVEYVKDKFIWVNITEGAENLYIKEKFKVLGRRKDFPDQFIAYLSNRMATNGQLNKIKVKVEGYERTNSRGNSE